MSPTLRAVPETASLNVELAFTRRFLRPHFLAKNAQRISLKAANKLPDTNQSDYQTLNLALASQFDPELRIVGIFIGFIKTPRTLATGTLTDKNLKKSKIITK